MIHSLAIKTVPYTPSDGIFRVSGLQLRGAVRGKINPMSALPTSKNKKHFLGFSKSHCNLQGPRSSYNCLRNTLQA